MSESIAIETLLASYVDQEGGVLRVQREFVEKDYGDYALALDFDGQTNELLITLIKKEDAEYEDE